MNVLDTYLYLNPKIENILSLEKHTRTKKASSNSHFQLPFLVYVIELNIIKNYFFYCIILLELFKIYNNRFTYYKLLKTFHTSKHISF